MEKTERYTLGKSERLKSRKAIDHLFRSGKVFNVHPFRVMFDFSGNTSLQTGFGVSARRMKKAVDRNRIKRLMKEAWRLNKNNLQEILSDKALHLSVFLLFTGTSIPPYSVIVVSIKKVLTSLMKIADEKSE